MSTTRKILMLHGYGQNAYSMSRYMAPILNDVKGEVEFVYLDAPMALIPADINTAHALPAKTRTTASVPTTSPAENDTARGWFTIVNFGGNTMSGIDTSLELLKKTLRENRFEAIMGFSQGAAIAELIAAMLERPDLYPGFSENGAAVHPPLRYIVSVAGFLLRGQLAAWDGQTVNENFPSFVLSTPVLHVVGHTDVVVPRERADIFMGHHRNKRVEEHVGGHFVPSRRRWCAFFSRFFAHPFSLCIPSPSMTKGSVSFIPPPGSGLIAEYRMGDALLDPDFEDSGSESGASTPDSEGPSTPTDTVDRSLDMRKLENARLWDVYAGVVYQGEL